MARYTFLIILSLLLVLVPSSGDGNLRYGHARWRYRSWNRDPTRFMSQAPVSLEYISENNGTIVSEVEWLAGEDQDCVISDSTSPSTNMSCSTGGTKLVQLKRGGSASTVDSFYVDIDSVADCGYHWYMTFASGPSSRSVRTETPSLEFYVWIVSANHASEQERDTTATLPSSYSASLSKEFYMMGEKPHLSLESLREVSLRTEGDTVFDNAKNVWVGHLNTHNEELVEAVVSGKKISVLNCNVADGVYPISVTHQALATTFPAGPEAAFISALAAASFTEAPSSSSSIFTIRRNPCAHNVAVAFLPVSMTTDRHFLVTDNAFVDTQLVAAPLPASVPDSTNSAIIDAAFANETIVLLTNTTVFYGQYVNASITPIWTESTFTTSASSLSSSSSPPYRMDRIRSGGACSVFRTSKCDSSFMHDVVMAWNTAVADSFYLSTDGGISFTNVTLPAQYTESLVTISDIQLNAYDAITLLLIYSDREAVLMYSSFTSSGSVSYTQPPSWSLGHSFTDAGKDRISAGSKACSPSITMSASTSGELYVWGDTLTYSSNGGVTTHVIALRNRDPSVSGTGLASDEYIAQVTTSASGHAAVLTSTNRLFITAASLSYALEIQSGTAPSARIHLSLSSQEALLHVLQLHTTSPYVTQRRVPWRAELQSPRVPVSNNPASLVTCPFMRRVDDADQTYYLDINERLDMTFTAITAASQLNFLSVSVSDQSKLRVSSSQSVFPVAHSNEYYASTAASSGTVSSITTATFTESPGVYANRAERVGQATGPVSIRSTVARSNLGCDTIQKVTNVMVGCPPGRHIRVRLSVDCIASAEDQRNTGGSAGSGSSASGGDGSASTSSVADGLGHCSSIDYVSPGEAFDPSNFPCPMRVYHQLGGYRPIIDLYDGDVFVKELTGGYIVWEASGRSDFTVNGTAGDAGCVSQPTTFEELAEQGLGPEGWTAERTHDCFKEDPTRPLDKSTLYQIINTTGVSYITFPLTGGDGIFYFHARVVDPNYSYCDLETRFALNVYGAQMDALTAGIIVMICTAFILLVLLGTYVFYRHKILNENGTQFKED